MKKKSPKTSGLDWVIHSLNAFNGSGYANRTSPETFLESYVQYKKWKKKPTAVVLVQEFWGAVLPVAEHLVTNCNDAGIQPSSKQLERFNRYKSEQNQESLV